jgi:hypothetical protein
MKIYLRFLSIAAFLGLLAFGSTAQESLPGELSVKPGWVSEKGYWVIESNVKTPKSAIVYFYNNENELVYKERVEGIKLNVKKDATKMKLKKVLETAVWAWEAKQPVKESDSLARLVSGEKQ